MKTYRVYCMGYEPGGVPCTKAEMARLMDSADVCTLAPHGIPIGTLIKGVEVIDPGDGRGPPAGRVTLRCVSHEAKGKIAIMEDQSS